MRHRKGKFWRYLRQKQGIFWRYLRMGDERKIKANLIKKESDNALLFLFEAGTTFYSFLYVLE